LLILASFDEESALPEPLSKLEIYAKLRAVLESTELCGDFVMKFKEFQPHFKKVKDADEKLGRRTKMFVPASAQNRMNATHRLGSDEGDQERFKSMERWTMHFWRLMPRTVARYISLENQGRDGQKQTILDAENILKAADNRNSLICWDRQHTRWSRLSEEAQIRSVPRLELLCAPARFQLHLCMLLFWPVPRPDRLCCCVINLGGAPTVFMVVNLLFCFTAGAMLFFANGITPMWTTSLVMILSSKTIMLLQFHSLPRSPVLSRPS